MPEASTRQLTVAIIGAGPLGRWLALRAGRSGLRVMLEDVMPGTLRHAREYIREQLNVEAMRSANVGAMRRAGAALELAPTGGTVALVSTIEDAVRTADLVIDCVPDELESKLEILWLLDRMAPPQTVFATPTTAQSIEDLASCTYRADRCIAIAAQPKALAELEGRESAAIPLRTGPATSAATLALVEGFWRTLGFATVVSHEGLPSARRPAEI